MHTEQQLLMRPCPRPACTKLPRFLNKAELDEHVVAEHEGEAAVRHPCPVLGCDLTFDAPPNGGHLRVHPLCLRPACTGLRRFLDKAALVAHEEAVHEGEI